MIPGLKRTVITGGTGGLGTAIADVFCKAGWGAVRLGREDLDLGDPGAVDSYFSGELCDLLICAAGCTGDAPLGRISESGWDTVFGVNYEAAERCAAAAIPGMVRRGGGHVVFVSSHAAIHPAGGQVAYATAKAALLGLTADLAASWGGMGVRVNAVLPGFLETPMTAGVSEKRRMEILGGHHLGRFNTAAAAAEFMLFLDEKMPHTSGQVFQLDSRAGIF